MKVFRLCFGMMIVMLGIWIEVGIAQDPITITETQMPDANLRAAVLARLKAFSIVGSTDTTFTNDNMADARFVSMYEYLPGKITDLTGLEYAATPLTVLNLDDNSISDISVVSKLTNLTELVLSSNSIEEIPDLSGLTSLTKLNLGFNGDISNIPNTLPTSLTELRLSDNSISSISNLSRLTNLTILTLENNKISNISAVSGLTNLSQLILNGNSISNISAVSGLTNLTRLQLNSNKISAIPDLSGLTKLKELRLNRNSVSDISALSSLTELTTLRLSYNEISDISALSSLTKLTTLTLSSNKISDISALSSLTKLTLLYIGDSKISTIDALLSLSALETLDLAGHRIIRIDEFQKLSDLPSLRTLYLEPYPASAVDLEEIFNNPESLRRFIWVRPSAIDAQQAVSFKDYPENPPTETFSFTIRFDEPVYGFQMEDIIVETKLDIGTGTATLEALTPTTEPAQTYIATIGLPPRAAGTLRIIVRAGAAITEDGRIDPAVDRVFGPIAFSTLPPPKRKIVYQCPVGWQRSNRFGGRNWRVLLYEVNLEMDLHNRASIYKPTSVAIYVHPDEALETLDGWKLQVAIPYNHHRNYLLTAENSVVVDSEIEGVEGGFAFIKNPEADPFPMVGMGFTGATVPGFDYRLYDDRGQRVDFGIACYKRGDIFQVLRNMEDPRVLRKVLLETLDWEVPYIRSEWTVPVPVPAAPSLIKKTIVGTWGDLKKQ